MRKPQWAELAWLSNFLFHSALDKLLCHWLICRQFGELPCMFLQEKGEALWEQVKALAPQHRTRPSLLAPAARVTAFAVGAASACLPGSLRATIGGTAAPLLTAAACWQPWNALAA